MNIFAVLLKVIYHFGMRTFFNNLLFSTNDVIIFQKVGAYMLISTDLYFSFIINTANKKRLI